MKKYLCFTLLGFLFAQTAFTQEMLLWDANDANGVVIQNSQLSKDTPYSFPIFNGEGEAPTNISMSIDGPASNYGQGSSLCVYFEDANGVLTHGKVIWSETKDLGVETFSIDAMDWQSAKRFGLFLVLNAGSMGQAWADGVFVDFSSDPNGGYNLIFQGKEKNANIQFLPVELASVTVNGNIAGSVWVGGIEGDVLEVASGAGAVEATSLDVLSGNGELCWKAHGPNSLVGFSRSNFRMPPGLLKKDREVESGIFVGEDGNAYIVEHGVSKKKLPLSANAEGHGFCIRREDGNLVYSYEGVDVFTSYWLVDDGKPLMVNVLIAEEGSYVVDVAGKGFGKRETDSDMDGLSDTWELEYGLNPTNKYDALEDTDGDGVLNYQEYADGTSPLQPEYAPLPTDYLWWMRGTEYSQGSGWIDLSERGHDAVSDTSDIEKVSEDKMDFAYLDMGDEIRCGEGAEPWLSGNADDAIGFTLMVALRPLWDGLGYENLIDLSSGSSSNGGFRLGIQDGVWVVDSPGNEGAYLDNPQHGVSIGKDTVIIVRYGETGLLEIWVDGVRQTWMAKSLIKNITGEGYIHRLNGTLANKESKVDLILSALMSLIAPTAYAQTSTDSFAMVQEIILLGRTVSYAEIQTLNATYRVLSDDLLFQTWSDYCGDFSGDPDADPDGDGFSVKEEVFLGTDPFDEASLFKINISNLWDGDIKLHWLGAEGRAYEVEGTERLFKEEGTNRMTWVSDGVATGTGAELELIKTATGLYYWRLKMAGSLDTDEDGLPDWLELCLGSNPGDVDTDGDGMNDGMEIKRGLPDVGDSDGDGLEDWQEKLIYDTYYYKEDSDLDNLLDGDEILIYYTDPNDKDSDDDGLQDGDECHVYGTEPLIPDTDRDGLWDGEEVATYRILNQDYQWVDISATANYLVPGTNTLIIDPVYVSFTIDFYGETLNAWKVSPYGTISLLATHNRANENTAFSNVSFTVARMLAPFWDDLVYGMDSRIYFQELNLGAGSITTGSCLVVTWENMQHADDPNASFTFQLIMNASTGEIIFQYDTLMAGNSNALLEYGSSATVGIKTKNPIHHQYAFNQPFVYPGLALRFVPTDSDPTLEDTDGGTIWDGEEIRINGTLPRDFSDDLNPGNGAMLDSDNDGYFDHLETYHGTFPNDNTSFPDSDGDNLPDLWEIQHFGDLSQSGIDDADGDQVNNLAEYLEGTDPNDPTTHDADDDGLLDSWEIQHFGNLDSRPDDDPDNDGLNNALEYTLATLPTNEYSDADSLPDGWEYTHGLSPADAAGNQGDTGDLDSDGYSNLEEYNWGSHPNDPDSFPVGTVTGDIIYGGNVTGLIYVLAVDDPGSWDLDYSIHSNLTEAGGYTLRLNETGQYWIKVFVDDNPNERMDTHEWRGAYLVNPLTLFGSTNGIDITLLDPVLDSDGDEMPDWWELQYGLAADDPTGDNGPDNDPDGDKINNFDEWIALTHPLDASDKDGDGIPDDWEIWYFGDTSSSGVVDPDGDALHNLDEFDAGTNPTLEDTDGDGMPDGWEVENNLDPLDPSDASGNPDNDGFTNFEEYLGNTDPHDPNSIPISDISGAIIYDGLISGPIWILANTVSTNWSISNSFATSITATGTFTIANVSNGIYWIKAFHDGNGNGLLDTNEVRDVYYDSPLGVYGASSNIVIELYDPDSDSDGLPDWWERYYWGHLFMGAGDDPDGDNLDNLTEYNLGTSPINPDSDGDGMPDDWEHDNGLDPNDPSGDNGPVETLMGMGF